MVPNFLKLAVVGLLVSVGLQAADLKVGLVLDKGGRDDKSFNAAAFRGATDAQKKLGIQLKVVESGDDTAIEPNLRTFAQKGYDLVIGIGFVQGTALAKVAKEFPKTHFLLVDNLLELPNVRSVIFKEHEGSYLVGAIAALTSKTNTIGFVGGMDIPLVRRFEMGYAAGAKAVNPKVTVLTNYIGSGSDAWKNPMKGKELALSQYNKKADVVFHVAGASGLGIFDAAEETKKFAIGVDSNQNWIKPGRVLTSMIKGVDVAVYKTIEELKAGKFAPGKFSMGFAENAIDFALDEHNRAILTPEVEKRANALKADIISGKIKVPDLYELNKNKKS